MNCPSCGAELEVDDRFAHLVVCGFCDTSLIHDARALRVAGKMATIKPPTGRFYLGATGRLGDLGFRVIGRVRYGYQAGYWDEWFLSLEDGETAWVSEDEDELVLESLSRLDGRPFGFADADPGDRLEIGGAGFTITEKNHATCEGGAGQLPFMIVPGERVPYFDLTGDDTVGTVEFDDDGVKVFLGKVIDPAKVRLDRTREEAGVGPEFTADGGGYAGARARIQKGSRGAAGAASLKCTSCGAPQHAPATGDEFHACDFCGAEIDLRATQVDCPGCDKVLAVKLAASECVVCPGCRSQVDVTGHTPTILATLAKKRGPDLPIKLGMKGTIRGGRYEVVGHIRFVERDAWGVYVSDEFLLRPLHPPGAEAKPGPPRWLVYEDGHFTWGQEKKGQPRGLRHPKFASQRATFSFGAETYTVFEVGESPMTIEWVDGELPWVAQVGDRFRYMDAVAPPKMISAEWTENELEWFEAEYLPAPEVAEGFGLRALPEPEGVAPCQPYETTPFWEVLPPALVLYGLLSMFMIAGAYGTGSKVFRSTIPLKAIDNAEFITEPFTVSGAPTVLQLDGYCKVSNAWVYAQVALLDEQDRAVVETDSDISYYHGYSGGESWREGSQSDSQVFCVEKPGPYRLLVYAKGGSGNYGKTMPTGAGSLMLTLYQGVHLARYWILSVILALPLGLWFATASARFEARRWAPVTDSDDDD